MKIWLFQFLACEIVGIDPIWQKNGRLMWTEYASGTCSIDFGVTEIQINWRNFDGCLHRVWKSGPAQITFTLSGEVKNFQFRENGVLHRPRKQGPAWFNYNGSSLYREDGKIVTPPRAENAGPDLWVQSVRHLKLKGRV